MSAANEKTYGFYYMFLPDDISAEEQQQILERARKLADQYRSKNGEIIGCGPTPIFLKEDPSVQKMTFMIVGTRKAAEILADAFRELEVKDAHNNRIQSEGAHAAPIKNKRKVQNVANRYGVEAADIADSIRKAGQFIQDLNVGPATNEFIAPLLDEENLNTIKNAPTNEELKQSLRITKIDYVLLCVRELLTYHAAANTDNIGADIYREITRWAGLDGVALGGDAYVEDEIEHHIRFQPKKNLSEPESLSPIDHYGLVYPNQPGEGERVTVLDIEEGGKWHDISKAATTFLKSFFGTGEINGISGLGSVGKYDWDNPQNNKIGASFRGTREIAQALADKFPDLEVIDSKDNRIAPSQAAKVTHSKTQTSATAR